MEFKRSSLGPDRLGLAEPGAGFGLSSRVAKARFDRKTLMFGLQNRGEFRF